MAKKKRQRQNQKPKTKVTPAQKPGDVIIQQLITRPVNRRRADIEKWRQAHRSAETTLTGSRVNLYDLYDDVMLDGTLSSVINKRIMAVTNTKLRFVKDGEDIEDVKKIIGTEQFKDILREIMLSKFWGISVIDIPFFDGMPVPYSVPRKHIRPKTGIITHEQMGTTGFSYREGMFLNTILEVGKPDDLGLLLKAVPYALYKRGVMGDWAQFTEIFGMPTKVARYSGYDPQTRMALEEALDDSGSALTMIIPDEAKLEFLDAQNASARSEIYDSLKKACNDEILILILGQTGTTEDGKGSGYAQARIHAQTEDDINADDRDFIISVLSSQLSAIFAQAGLPMDGGEWMFEDPEEDISLKDRVAIDTELKASGLPIDDEYFYNKYGIPKPDNYDALKQEKAEKEAKEKQQKEKEAEAAKKKKKKKGTEVDDDDIEQQLSWFERAKALFT